MVAMRNLKVGAKIGLGFGIVLFILLGASVFSIFEMSRIQSDYGTIIDERYPKTKITHELIEDGNRIAMSVQGIVLFADQETLRKTTESVISDRKRIDAQLEELDRLSQRPEEKALLASIESTRESYSQVQNDIFQLMTANQRDEAKSLLLAQVIPRQAAYLEALKSYIQFQESKISQESSQATHAYTLALFISLILGLLGILFSLGVCWWVVRYINAQLGKAVGLAQNVAAGDLTTVVAVEHRDEFGLLNEALMEMNLSLRRIVGEVRSSCEATTHGARQIAEGNADLAQRTEEQATSLQATAVNIRELAGLLRDNAGMVSEANELAMRSTSVAEQGGQVVGQVVASMISIKESSDRIRDIISVIDSIAFQTNILALNAAVEAARAGEQGRGFAVVAAEVRRLAQHSAAAAKEIGAIISDSADRVVEGTRQVDIAGHTMEEIVVSFHKVTELMSRIAMTSRQELTGFDQVNEAIMRIDDVTQQNAALVEQVAAAGESLEEQARNLELQMSVFNVNNDVDAAMDGLLEGRSDQLSGARVLVVDDNRIIQEVVKRFLSLVHVTVEIAENGKEALAKLEHQPFDLVLMDIQMPVMDGIEATRLIRQQSRFQDLPVLVLSAGLSPEEQKAFRAIGMNDFVAKPINPDKLTDKLVEWLKR